MQGQRQLPDLVEEERAAVCGLEQLALVAVRAREGSAIVAEQLGLEQQLRKRREIEAGRIRLYLHARAASHRVGVQELHDVARDRDDIDQPELATPSLLEQILHDARDAVNRPDDDGQVPVSVGDVRVRPQQQIGPPRITWRGATISRARPAASCPTSASLSALSSRRSSETRSSGLLRQAPAGALEPVRHAIELLGHSAQLPDRRVRLDPVAQLSPAERAHRLDEAGQRGRKVAPHQPGEEQRHGQHQPQRGEEEPLAGARELLLDRDQRLHDLEHPRGRPDTRPAAAGSPRRILAPRRARKNTPPPPGWSAGRGRGCSFKPSWASAYGSVKSPRSLSAASPFRTSRNSRPDGVAGSIGTIW